ncbi:MAG: DUF4197 domain-containing protein [Bacteroidetes bacterium]|nr:DUF4197 domain-containing protein [Bacteroidota bacterium]
MKNFKLITCSLLIIGFLSCKAQNLNNLFNNVKTTVKKGTLTNEDITKGLKEALKVGTNNSVASSSKLDGFNKNSKIKIPFPSEATAMETKLRAIGMGSEVDKFVETLNRGAEEAAKTAATVFVDAITKLSIADGMKILKGEDNAATTYLKDNTTTQLKTNFGSIVHNALIKVEITKYWTPLATAYNKIPLVTKINPDLDAYVTEKAIAGLFILIADEEYKIRKNPEARISDILKKVFG